MFNCNIRAIKSIYLPAKQAYDLRFLIKLAKETLITFREPHNVEKSLRGLL